MQDSHKIKVLFITTEWPTKENPYAVPFLVRQVQLLKESGINVQVFHFRGKRNPINYLKAWWRIRQIPYWKEADILHAHWGQSAFPALFSGKKLVITFHGSDLYGIVNVHGKQTFQGRALTLLSKCMASQADYCITVSARLKKMLGARINKISIIPMGIDLQKFHPMEKNDCREKLNLTRGTRFVLFVSDPMRPEKRYWMAQTAVTQYRERHPEEDLQLLVVHGVEHDQIPVFLNAGDVLLITSSYEGGPIIAKEAIASNLPVVSFNVGDVEEWIKDLDGCYLCEEATVESLINGLEIALAHGPLNNLSERLQNRINEINTTCEVIAVYQSLMSD
jgi:glycosyltransferase involved in cell wall biosynthesis